MPVMRGSVVRRELDRAAELGFRLRPVPIVVKGGVSEGGMSLAKLRIECERLFCRLPGPRESVPGRHQAVLPRTECHE